MSWADYMQALLALIFVLGLLGILIVALRRLGFGSPTPTLGNRNKRVRVIEVTTLDARRKLVLVRHDEREHLLLLGANGETVVESRDGPPLPELPLPPAEAGSFSKILRQSLGSGRAKDQEKDTAS